MAEARTGREVAAHCDRLSREFALRQMNGPRPSDDALARLAWDTKFECVRAAYIHGFHEGMKV